MARTLSNTRLHAAIFASADPAAKCSMIMGGTIADIQANVPTAGTWRVLPVGVNRVADVPALGQLPTPVIPVTIP
jgi:hypothetical protein